MRFRSIIMTLWICQCWQILKTNFKQSIWSLKQALFYSYTLVFHALGKDNQEQQTHYIRHYRFISIFAVWPKTQFWYNANMPKIDIINYHIEGVTKTYPFVPFMANKSTTSSSIIFLKILLLVSLDL